MPLFISFGLSLLSVYRYSLKPMISSLSLKFGYDYGLGVLAFIYGYCSEIMVVVYGYCLEIPIIVYRLSGLFFLSNGFGSNIVNAIVWLWINLNSYYYPLVLVEVQYTFIPMVLGLEIFQKLVHFIVIAKNGYIYHPLLLILHLLPHLWSLLWIFACLVLQDLWGFVGLFVFF